MSDRATILYIFTIPHLDDEGFIDADPNILKGNIVPLRDNISVKNIPDLIKEIINVHQRVSSSSTPLWVIHQTTEGTFIQDPVFHERQSFKGIRKKPSKIKDVVDREIKGKQKGDDRETKGFISKGECKGECKGEGEVNVKPIKNKRVSPENLKDLFNSIVKYLPKITELGKSRKEKIKTRINEGKDNIEWWEIVFRKADQILIPGKDGKKDWFPNFDWLIKNDENSVKVFEGNYDDAKRPLPLFKPQPGIAALMESERKKVNEP